ncbi:MAG: hypothetical protein ACOCWO_03115 [Candidatus Muiribacteriaceae bacterium]
MHSHCSHSNITVLTTPGIDHEIFLCEDCFHIIGTSDDFIQQDITEEDFDKVCYIRKPIENVLMNIS